MDRSNLSLRIDALIRRSRIWSVAQAGADWFSATAGAALVLCLLDYSLRFQDRGMRVLISCAFFAMAAWTARRFFLPVLRATRDPLVVAQRLELGFPQLRGLLAAAVDFQRHDEVDPDGGSHLLRAAVVRRATMLAQETDFGRVLDFRGPRRALGIAALTTVVGAALVVVEPLSAGLAIQRLANPWNEAAWPRRHRLKFKHLPMKAAAGQDIALEVVDESGQAPEQITFRWHYQDEPESQGTLRTATPVGDRAVFQVERPLRPFRMRAAGGDDDTMPWFDVDVVEPPIVELADAVIVAPEYTGEPPRPIGQPARAWVGSHIKLRGDASRPLAAVSVRRLDGGDAVEAEGRIEQGGLSFQLGDVVGREWVIRESGTFVLEVTDLDGVTGEVARWVVEAITDLPPTLSLVSPSAMTQATAQARVLVRGLAKDDMRLRRVELRYRWTDAANTTDNPPAAIVLLDQPSTEHQATSSPSNLAEQSIYRVTDDRYEIDSSWEIGDNARIQPGMTVELRVAAIDSAGQVTETDSRRIEIVTADEFAQRLSRRETVLLEQIREALRIQREAWERTRQVAELAPERTPTPKDADQLQGVELAQRAASRLLADEQTGVLPQIAALVAEYRGNRLESGPAVARLDEIGAKLRGIADVQLPAVERDLLHAVRALRESMREFRAPLGNAVNGQRQVVETLEDIVGRLAPWDLLQRQMREIAEARVGIEAVRDETERLLTQSPDAASSDSPAMRESLRKALAERQFEWARKLDRAFADMSAASDAASNDQRLGQAVEQALEVVRRTTPAASIQQAGQATLDNRLGAATEGQQNSLDALNELLEVMASSTGTASGDRSNKSDSRAARELEEWRAAVEELVTRQAEVVDGIDSGVTMSKEGKTNPAASPPRELADRQEEVVRRSADRLAGLPDRPAFRFALRGAIQQMRDAVQSLRGERIEEASVSSRHALRRLERLGNAARESAKPASSSSDPRDKPDLAPSAKPPAEGPSRMSLADLALVREIQEELRERTARVEASRGDDGMLAPPARRELESVAREQGELAQLLGELVE